MNIQLNICCVHLQGNRQCPNTALYGVSWRPHTMANSLSGYEQRFTRNVCVGHLQRAIDEALNDCPRPFPLVEVGVLPEGEWAK